MSTGHQQEDNICDHTSDYELSQLSDKDKDIDELRKISSQEIDTTDFSDESELRQNFVVGVHYHGYLPNIYCDYCGEQITPEEVNLWEHLVDTHPRRIILAEYRFKNLTSRE